MVLADSCARLQNATIPDGAKLNVNLCVFLGTRIVYFQCVLHLTPANWTWFADKMVLAS
jgi:hypothetical protein